MTLADAARRWAEDYGRPGEKHTAITELAQLTGDIARTVDGLVEQEVEPVVDCTVSHVFGYSIDEIKEWIEFGRRHYMQNAKAAERVLSSERALASELCQKVQELREERDALKADNREQVAINCKLSDRVEELEGELEKSSKRCNQIALDKLGYSNALKQCHSERDRNHDRWVSAEAALADLHKENEEIRKANENLDEENLTLRAEVKDLKANPMYVLNDYVELNSKNLEIVQLRSELTEASRRAAAAMKESARLSEKVENQRHELARLSSTIERLQNPRTNGGFPG